LLDALVRYQAFIVVQPSLHFSQEQWHKKINIKSRTSAAFLSVKKSGGVRSFFLPQKARPDPKISQNFYA
jgi:hypothetical protein